MAPAPGEFQAGTPGRQCRRLVGVAEDVVGGERKSLVPRVPLSPVIRSPSSFRSTIFAKVRSNADAFHTHMRCGAVA
jgi:hypothetical protein